MKRQLFRGISLVLIAAMLAGWIPAPQPGGLVPAAHAAEADLAPVLRERETVWEADVEIPPTVIVPETAEATPMQPEEDAAVMAAADGTQTVPYYYQYNEREMVGVNTRQLVYTETDKRLAGINGLDLAIKATYSTDKARFDTSGGETVLAKGPSSVWNDTILGVGWRFAFSSFDVRYRCFYLADGREIQLLPFAPAYSLELVTLSAKIAGDLSIQWCSDSQYASYSSACAAPFHNGQEAAVCCVTYADGVQEYFNANGAIIGIRDRCGNTVRFVYGTSDLFDVTITDTVNRTTRIYQTAVVGGAYSVIVDLPGAGDLTYAVDTASS